MSTGQEPYDPYIPNSGAAPAGGAGNNRTQALQAVSYLALLHMVLDPWGLDATRQFPHRSTLREWSSQPDYPKFAIATASQPKTLADRSAIMWKWRWTAC
jgi:hypothetical protein